MLYTSQLVACGLVAMLVGVATADEKEKSSRKTVDAGGYTVEAPAGKGWKTQVDTAAGVVQFQRKQGSVLRQLSAQERITTMLVFRNRSLDTVLNAAETASNYITNELKIMETQGVEAGEYDLDDMFRDTLRFEEKLFYFLSYRKRIKPGNRYTEDGALYLYFPNTFEGDRTFFGFLFSDLRTGASLGKSEVYLLRSLAASFRIK